MSAGHWPWLAMLAVEGLSVNELLVDKHLVSRPLWQPFTSHLSVSLVVSFLMGLNHFEDPIMDQGHYLSRQ